MIGKTISHYKILEELGRGGMGVVYKATDLDLERAVAIKFLPQHLSRDEDARQRFIHEAKAASALNHSNIGVIHEIGRTDDGQTFIVMAYYEGETLRERIDRGGMSTEEALEIATQVAAGLAKAHDKDIVHRDIKPSNIIITKDREAKIIDFGLAKLAGKTKLTKEGSTLGTAAYMSPEQARGEEVDHPSDIFSLGSILYEMLAGETPFKGEHEAALLYKIVHEEPQQISDRCKGIPAAICAVIERAMKKDSGNRYQSAVDMRNDLKDLQAAGGSTTNMRTSSQGSSKGTGKGLWIGIAAAIVIVAMVIILMITGREPAPLTASEMSLAVVDFRDMSTSADPVTSVMLTELLNTSLIESCPIRVKSPEHLRYIQKRIFGSADSQVKEGQELEIARESKATYVLTGSMGVLENERFVTWRLIDVRNGDHIGGGRVESGRMSAMVDEIVAAVLPKVAGASGIEQPVEQVSVEQITTSSSPAYEHYTKGRLIRIQGLPEEALKELELAVSIDSSFALAYLEMARLYFGVVTITPDVSIARLYTDKACKLESRLGIKDRMHLKAFRYGLDYEVVQEMAKLREILELWPDDRESLKIILGKAYWWWYFEDAVEIARKGMKLFPDDPMIGGPTYISALRTLGRFEESYHASRDYLQKFPNEPNAWDELAKSCLSMAYPDSAEIAYQKVFEIDPGWGRESLAYCAYYAGDLERAISIFEDILSSEDLSRERCLHLMYQYTHLIQLPALYYEAGRYGDAVRTMDEARQYIGDDPSYWQYQAGSLFAAVGLAGRALEIVSEMDKNDEIRSRHFALRFKGQAQVVAGDLAGARGTAARSHELSNVVGPMLSYPAYKTEAGIALAEKDPASAKESLEALGRIGVVFGGMLHIEYLTMLAEAYHMAGNLEEAVAVNRETLRIYGGHALSHYELGRLYEELGQLSEAIEHYAKFLEMWKNADEELPQPEHARARLAVLKGRI